MSDPIKAPTPTNTGLATPTAQAAAQKVELKAEPAKPTAEPQPETMFASKQVKEQGGTKTIDPSQLDWEAVNDKLTQISAHLISFEGKAGHNPHIYFKKYVNPLKSRYAKGERTLDLFQSIMQFQLIPPTVETLHEDMPSLQLLPASAAYTPTVLLKNPLLEPPKSQFGNMS